VCVCVCVCVCVGSKSQTTACEQTGAEVGGGNGNSQSSPKVVNERSLRCDQETNVHCVPVLLSVNATYDMIECRRSLTALVQHSQKITSSIVISPTCRKS
jgi:hypothetical protein